jgi:predicted enzyme related to lactoylglutathione lyase
MFKENHAFSGFAVKDLGEAKKFYEEKLGLEIEGDLSMGLNIKLDGGGHIFVYSKPDHVPATYTILNFPVDDIEQAVAGLKSAGIQIEHYEGMTDDQGIARGRREGKGPDIAWFKDPSGNVFSVLQN